MVLKWGVDTPGDPSNEGDGFEMGGWYPFTGYGYA